jgi:hypothetical protein
MLYTPEPITSEIRRVTAAYPRIESNSADLHISYNDMPETYQAAAVVLYEPSLTRETYRIGAMVISQNTLVRLSQRTGMKLGAPQANVDRFFAPGRHTHDGARDPIAYAARRALVGATSLTNVEADQVDFLHGARFVLPRNRPEAANSTLHILTILGISGPQAPLPTGNEKSPLRRGWKHSWTPLGQLGEMRQHLDWYYARNTLPGALGALGVSCSRYRELTGIK